MFGNNHVEDWRALTEHYRSMCDEELQELAADFNDLTPTAQQVLRDELKLRKLGDPQAPRWQSGTADGLRTRSGSAGRREGQSEDAANEGAAESNLPVEYTWKTLLCACEGDEQAWQVAEVLRRAGIESWIESATTYANSSGSLHASIDEGERRVFVAADQLDEARQVAARPIPQDIVDQSKFAPPVYEPPVCPRCGAADPVLEGVEPVNTWKCEGCGAQWEDSAPEADEPT